MGQSKRTRLQRWWRYSVIPQCWRIVSSVNRFAYLKHRMRAFARDPNPDQADYFEEMSELQFRETTIWLRRGYRLHLSVYDEIPLPDGCTSHLRDAYNGERYVEDKRLRKFK